MTVIEGVDPGLVFKVRASGRITDETWSHRGVALLGDTDDWTYFVLSEDEVPERLVAELRRYTAGREEMGGRAPLRTFFSAVEDIQPYGPDDCRTPTLPDNLRDLGEPILVDVISWPSPTPQEAERRLSNIRRVVDFYGAYKLARDSPAALATIQRPRARRRRPRRRDVQGRIQGHIRRHSPRKRRRSPPDSSSSPNPQLLTIAPVAPDMTS